MTDKVESERMNRRDCNNRYDFYRTGFQIGYGIAQCGSNKRADDYNHVFTKESSSHAEEYKEAFHDGFNDGHAEYLRQKPTEVDSALVYQ